MKGILSRNIVPLPFPVYFWTVAVLAAMGLADAVYLSISHYRVYTDIGYASFCAISKAINCDTVSQSPYSILWGVPVPVWGVFGYVCVLGILPFAGSKEANKARLWPLLFWIFLGFSLYSLALGMISALYIHSYCLMCIVSYAINFLLLFYAWLIPRRFGKNRLIADLVLDVRFLWHKKRPQTMALTMVFGTVLLVMITKFPAYWNLTPPPPSASVFMGATEEDHPWIGAQAPVLEIIEFSDYQCFQCKKMHFFLRRLVEKHPDKFRLVHRHYPMDHIVNPIVKEPFHVGSAAMSLLAIYAQSKGKFWEMNDILFNTDLAKGAVNTAILLKEAGIDTGGAVPDIYDPQVQSKLVADVIAGLKLGITGTPAYHISGQIYLGQIPPDILENIIR
jgi:uncharacterized membrane protein/predicted DsbA family dithiol-disulfide isomerase